MNPNYAAAHQWYGEYLQTVGRTDEALAVMRRALDLDPLSLVINKEMGEALYNARRYDQALFQLNETLEIDRSFAPAHAQRGLTLLHERRYQDALAAFQQARNSGGETSGLALVAYTHAISGRAREARALLGQLDALSSTKYVPRFVLGVVHLGLGDRDRAFTLLREACEARDNQPALLRWLAGLDDVRSDPRYGDLFRCMKLTP